MCENMYAVETSRRYSWVQAPQCLPLCWTAKLNKILTVDRQRSHQHIIVNVPTSCLQVGGDM